MGEGGDGLLFVVSGPSGAGKTTLLRRLLEEDSQVRFSVSMTTRPPRPGEREGVDYFFVNEEEFQRALEAGQLLEWAEVHGHRYGTPVQPVEEQRRQGYDVVLDIDVQGAKQVKERRPEAIGIFVYPPSWEVLEARLGRRGTEASTDLARRLEDARWELQQYRLFDYLLLNDDLETAYQHLRAIFLAERCRRRPQRERQLERRFPGIWPPCGPSSPTPSGSEESCSG